MYIDEIVKDYIWHRAKVVPGFDKNKIRQDLAGAWIYWDSYNQEDEFGWTIGPLMPVEIGGFDDLAGLQPYHWKNYRSKGLNFPYYSTIVSSEGNRNILLEKKWNYLTEVK